MSKEKEEILANEQARFIRRNKLNYQEFNKVVAAGRKIAGLKTPKRKIQAHVLPSKEELSKFLDVLAKGKLKHDLMVRLMWFTGLRNFELCNIKMKEVYLDEVGGEKILIHGKGGFDRFVAIPPKLSRDLKYYVRCFSNNIYLFESRIGKSYTTAGFRAIVRKYRDLAGLSDKIYPNNFRHVVGTISAELGFNNQK